MSKIKSLGVVVAVIVAYYLVVVGFFWLAPEALDMEGLTAADARVAAGFLVGVSAQLLFVLALILAAGGGNQFIPLNAVLKKSTKEGWIIAAIVTGIELAFLYLVWIDRSLIRYVGIVNSLLLTVLPAVDGIVQELFFRGFVISRLKDAGFGPGFQLVISSIAFAGLHLGYGAQNFELTNPAAWLPVAGTFAFGLGLGFSVIRGGYALLPAIISHTVVILAVQPWLALT